jgi:hypothetical protein
MSKRLKTLGLFVAFAGLAMGSGGDDKKAPTAPEKAGNSPVKTVEKKAEAPSITCKTNVDGKFGSMLDKIAKEHNDKTDVQKEAYEAAVEKEWAEKGYCGKVTGSVTDVQTGLRAKMQIGCKAPSNLDGAIVLENIDGQRFRGMVVFLPKSRVTKDFAATKKGDKLEMEVIAYSATPSLNGYVCTILK